MSRNLHLCFTKIKSPEHGQLPQNHSCDPSSFTNFNSVYETFNDRRRSDSDSDTASTPDIDIATAFASRRFFFSSPGRSNSIIDSSSSSIASTSSASLGPHPETTDAVAVPTFSPDPFLDFRRSMQEMVEARHIHDVHHNWDYLHDLLMCYLSLNPKTTHKFIVGAFADLLVSLMTAPPENCRRKTPFSDGKLKITRQL